jgi:glutamine synthetase
MPYQAEYIWIDGTVPTPESGYVGPLLRSKTKIIPDGEEPPVWGFDGSSTNQASGDNSDVVLNPVYTCPDPVRGGNNVLVLNEVLLTDMTPHPTNQRRALAEVEEKYGNQEPWFGIEQEYTFYREGRPLGWPAAGFPGPQGPYYCGVGADEIWGREVVEAHTVACLEAGIAISGTNAEVMMGQWEFQVGPVAPLAVSDQLWVARWLLYRISEEFDIVVTLNPKPIPGDWNGAGAHTNFSTKAMRESYEPIVKGAEALGRKHQEHITNYGAGVDQRLTGMHETAPWTEFSYGVSDRGASVRIPWQTARDQKGYLEDRRPNANMDPYIVTRLITNTVCEALV